MFLNWFTVRTITSVSKGGLLSSAITGTEPPAIEETNTMLNSAMNLELNANAIISPPLV